MSWSIGIHVDTASGDWDKKIYDLEVPLGEQDEEQNKAQEHAVKWAKDTVVDAIDCGVLGKDKKIGVSVSGHANPHHEPRVGWANDMITISISQIDERYFNG